MVARKAFLPPRCNVGIKYLDNPIEVAFSHIKTRARPGEEVLTTADLILLRNEFHDLLLRDHKKWGAVHHVSITSDNVTIKQLSNQVKGILQKEMRPQNYSESFIHC
jgi:hypothetical protein